MMREHEQQRHHYACGGLRRMLTATLLSGLLAGRPGLAADFDALADEYVHTALAQSPVAASDAGYHLHRASAKSAPLRMDSLLDQVDAAAHTRHAAWLHGWQDRFAALDPAGLDAEQRVDLAMLKDEIASELLELEVLRSWRHNPAIYVEQLGDALFQPMIQNYAKPERRLAQALDRLAQVPRYLDQARSVLESADPVFIDAARDENAGNIDLIQNDLRAAVAAYPALRRRHAQLAPPALRALKAYSAWLENTLAKRPDAPSWRLGPSNYAASFRLIMQADIEPGALLAQARAEFLEVRADLYRLAQPLHQAWFPDHGEHAELPEMQHQNRVIQEVLDRVAEDHVRPAELLPHIDGELQSITAFIRSHDLVSMGSNSNLHVVPTPEFERASYSVAGFAGPPPLDPEGIAQYWVTPIAPDAPAAATESRLREYNNQTLRWLTIHEALPGHYVQSEHANRVHPESRRLLRALYGNGAYVEGWAEYIAQVLMDHGYQGDDPRFRLVMRKIRLRTLANTILDIRLQTEGMSDADAMALMTAGALQTEAEAAGKLRRAKLSHVQLATYYVGLTAWQKVRKQVETERGARFNLREFHDQALDEGPVPLARLLELLRAKSAAAAN